MDAELLRQYLEFYQDLGIRTLYRQPAPVGQAEPEGIPPANSAATSISMNLPPLAPTGDTLLKIVEDIGDCRRCRLSEARNKIVFGDGNPQSPLVFVGEGPGADEDAQGLPFVGKSGQLLDKMIAAMGYSPDDIYICNIVKCRPPENRKPEPVEMAACSPFVTQQLAMIKPKVIVALGATAVQGLLPSVTEGITRLRGKWKIYQQTIPVMPTFHPAYLLRSPEAKRDVWTDLKAVMERLGKPIRKA